MKYKHDWWTATLSTVGIVFVLGTFAIAGARDSPRQINPDSRTLLLPRETFRYAEVQLPDYFVEGGIHRFDSNSEENPLTDAGATLGRALFYDVQLSANGAVSCASCHQQKHAFSDPRQFSVGFAGQKTDRNSMALTDARYARARFFWDERTDSLEEAVLTPLRSHVEMGMSDDVLVERLSSHPEYPALFQAAFGSNKIDMNRVAKALSQFIRSMTSVSSKYDQCASEVNSTEDEFAGFTDAENLGKTVFFDKCAACHTLGQDDHLAVFAMFRSLNNGIDHDGDARDGGRGDITLDPTEIGLFKASSLRNVEFTAPYMHDGRLESWMNLTYAAFVLVTATQWGRIQNEKAPPLHGWDEQRALRVRDGILPGVLLGLALLTKMQAIFLPPVFVLWALWYWRTRAILPVMVTAGVSFAVLMAGWPWLWADPVTRFIDYFARSTDRITLYCYYLGERYADGEVPWHYPFVMFAVTTPTLWFVLGMVGMSARWRKQCGYSLVLVSFLLPMIVFALPGVTVYDGVRLFLVVWPLFAVFVGAGGQWLFDALSQRGVPAIDDPSSVIVKNSMRSPESTTLPPGTVIARRRTVRTIVFVLIAIGAVFPAWSMVTLHPCQLSYYSELVGGLRGASHMGFEPTYWGDSVTPEFLERVAPHLPVNSRLAVAPVLHPLTLSFMSRYSWLQHRPDITLVAYDDNQANGPNHVLHIPRHADPWASLTPPPEGTVVLETLERDGVVLAELLQLP